MIKSVNYKLSYIRGKDTPDFRRVAITTKLGQQSQAKLLAIAHYIDCFRSIDRCTQECGTETTRLLQAEVYVNRLT